uniref:Uncharacterized protein n=1 Tax=Coccidioides posadasii RMSCC 3488 TaxID=454284 RepID=A0A0J6FGN2_COCPO|nr:hypothetical protein CPAG_08588 [Coccidioides posadasii RMSCC 3488]
MLAKKLYNHPKQGPCTSYYCSYKVFENSKFHAEIINTARSKYAVRIAICLTQVTDTGGNKGSDDIKYRKWLGKWGMYSVWARVRRGSTEARSIQSQPSVACIIMPEEDRSPGIAEEMRRCETQGRGDIKVFTIKY